MIILLAKEYELPEHLRDNILSFSQIGPPRNVSVDFHRDGYFVSWEPPEYGNDALALYIVRWFMEPGHKLDGSAETRETNYTGDKLSEVFEFKI